jgi:sulfatase modifying factor 1
MAITVVMGHRAVRSSHRFAAALVVFGATLSCGAPGRPSSPPSGAWSPCSAAAHRDPRELSLLAWDPSQRAEVRRLLGLGVVAVRYEQAAGCTVTLEVLPDCVGGARYGYAPYYAKDLVLVTSPEEAVMKLPLGVESLRRDLADGNAVRIDTVLAGQYALAPAQRVDGWDRPECERATHYVRSIDVGGLARASGERERLESAPSVFAMGGKAGRDSDGLRWRTDGSPAACQEAEAQGGEKAGCSAPLRLELVAIPPRGKAPICSPGMAAIPGGTFSMGSELGDTNEKPVHSVRLDGFCMDVTEVTVDAYTQCVHAGRCTVPVKIDASCNYGEPGKDTHPINCVTWHQASDYCTWQKKKLPTEEQWEYAARGGPEGRLYPWGNAVPDGTELCSSRSASVDGTCEVGSYPAGAFGLRDMAGNVWEWTDTKYCDSYAESKQCSDARVNRGSSWSDSNAPLRLASRRDWNTPSNLSPDSGFRCAR